MSLGQAKRHAQLPPSALGAPNPLVLRAIHLQANAHTTTRVVYLLTNVCVCVRLCAAAHVAWAPSVRIGKLACQTVHASGVSAASRRSQFACLVVIEPLARC